jgi:hypothetical protein
VPGTGTPMKNGLFLDEILEILSGINKPVIGKYLKKCLL